MSDRPDELQDVVLFLSMRVRALEARLAENGPDPARPKKLSGDGVQRFELAARAFARRKLPFSEQQWRRICQRHSWALKLTRGKRADHAGQQEVDASPWYVKLPDFDDFADLVEQGLARF
jgi:hypothetical protein